MDFFLILPSNANPIEHPDNSPSQFRVTLSDPIQLDGSWEVALDELTYVQSFQTIVNASIEVKHVKYNKPVVKVDMGPFQSTKHIFHPPNKWFECLYIKEDGRIGFVAKKNEDKLHFYCPRLYAESWGFAPPTMGGHIMAPSEPLPTDNHYIGVNNPHKDITYKSKQPVSVVAPRTKAQIIGVNDAQKDLLKSAFPIPPGYYSSPHELLPFLNQKKDYVEFAFIAPTNRFSIQVKKSDIIVTLKGGLTDILGLKETRFIHDTNNRATIAPNAPSMFAGSHSFFIYCSICADMNVANMKVPLLRTVAIKTKVNFGDVVNREFREPIFVPVNTNYISSIMIDIRNDMGNRIHFTEGKTQLVLRFRSTPSSSSA